MNPNIQLIDAHSHINFNAYKDDADEVIARARAAHVGMLAVGSQYSTSRRAVQYAENHNDIWAVVGLHPTHLTSQHIDEAEVGLDYQTEGETFNADQYRILAQSPRVVAIGECGLDYYRLPDDKTREELKNRQKTAFRAQVDLALSLNLPIMVHCRDAHDDLATILKKYAEKGMPVRGNIHCFTGTIAEAKAYLSLGMYISFTGIVSFPPKKAEIEAGETLADVVRSIPLDRMLIETDAPYLAPIPYRGKRNEPAYVVHVAEAIANILNVPTSEVMRHTRQNTQTLFNIS